MCCAGHSCNTIKGVGLSDPADYRVATEKTLFAMPETGIGTRSDHAHQSNLNHVLHGTEGVIRPSSIVHLPSPLPPSWSLGDGTRQRRRKGTQPTVSCNRVMQPSYARAAFQRSRYADAVVTLCQSRCRFPSRLIS